ncbi:MAG: sigma factor, partial [Opitutales bacterium]
MESLTLRMPESTITKAEAEEDTPTLADLFASMEGPLLAYGYQLMNDRDEAQDLLQEAFLRLHRCFDKVRRPQAWLYRTVRNLAFNHKRKHGNIIPFDPTGGEAGPSRETVDEATLPNAR